MPPLTGEKIKKLKKTANEIRKSIIRMLFEAGSGHTAGPLGMADILTLLYFHALKHDPQRPDWPERDRLILSNGHICPVLYATMAHSGYFPVDELLTLRKFGSRLQGHPHREYLSYLETSSGPLGSGLSQAIGMALAEKMDNSNSDKIFYCLMSDGELDEGQTWEAIMSANKHKLGNLIVIVDRNNIQIDGFTEEVMPLNNLIHKWLAFNWDVQEIDGDNFKEINNAIEKAKEKKDKPSVIIAHTIPGCGVRMFENNYHWHGTVPNKEQAKAALIELDENNYA
jgi:transketolase